MKKVVITAIVSVVLGLGGGWLIFRTGQPGVSSQQRKILYYRDPMSPQITSPIPKKAPDGMDFVPVYAESTAQGGERKITYYKDPMHPWYTSDKPGKAPDCGMDLVPVYEGESDAKGIKIDPLTIQNMGVRVETVERRKLNRTIRTTGRVSYDERKIYSVNSKIMGWVEKLYVDYTGMVVRKGEPLMDLYSPELVTTQQEYLQALQYRNKLQSSSLDGARQGSDDLLESARRRLLNWDIPEREINELEKRGTPKKTMTIYAPADGIIMEKMVQKGENIDAGMELFKIVDLSTVWVLADIYQSELPWVKLGQSVDIELSYLPGKPFKGKITFVYPYLNEETKTAKVRVEVSNTPSIELKPDMFATVKIASTTAVEAIAVPDDAIIRSGERTIAVIALGGGYFDPRDVKLGVSADGYDQVLEGIEAGEKIVVSSQFLIDSESNLKAAIEQMRGHSGTDTAGSEGQPMPSMDQNSGETHGHDSTISGRKPALEKGAKETRKSEKSSIDSKSQNQAMKPGVSYTDPVCGMKADDEKLTYTFNGTKYYFCSQEDLETFKSQPDKFVSSL